MCVVFFFKQKTAYEVRISDWSSDVCSSDLFARAALEQVAQDQGGLPFDPGCLTEDYELGLRIGAHGGRGVFIRMRDDAGDLVCTREYFPATLRSEEHTSELQSLMRISYAVFCLKKKKKTLSNNM